MTFPIGAQVTTTYLETGDGDPNLARLHLLDLVQYFNNLVASANLPEGIPLLNVSGQLSTSQLPNTWTPTAGLNLHPGNKIVSIRDLIRLTQVYTADLSQYAAVAQLGDVLFLVDGDAGGPCLSVHDGSDWRIVRLMTTVSAVGGTLAAVSTLACTVN